MLKSCSYCGRIHDSKYVCKQKEQKIRERPVSYTHLDVYKRQARDVSGLEVRERVAAGTGK